MNELDFNRQLQDHMEQSKTASEAMHKAHMMKLIHLSDETGRLLDLMDREIRAIDEATDRIMKNAGLSHE